MKVLTKPIKIGLPDVTVQIVEKYGTVRISTGLVLENVLYMPVFKHNLISVSQLLTAESCVFVFDMHGGCA